MRQILSHSCVIRFLLILIIICGGHPTILYYLFSDNRPKYFDFFSVSCFFQTKIIIKHNKKTEKTILFLMCVCLFIFDYLERKKVYCFELRYILLYSPPPLKNLPGWSTLVLSVFIAKGDFFL